MPILSHPSFGPKLSLQLILAGSMLTLWPSVWLYFAAPPWADLTPTTRFVVVGLIATGIIFMLVGFSTGYIGQAARRAELPPAEAINKEVAIQHTAAAVPNPVVTGGAAAVPTATAAPPAPAPVAGQPGVVPH